MFSIQNPSKSRNGPSRPEESRFAALRSSLGFAKDDYTVCIFDHSYRCLVALVMDHLFRKIIMRFTAIVTDINDKYGVLR